jgi:hypothetical protein
VASLPCATGLLLQPTISYPLNPIGWKLQAWKQMPT